MIYASPKVPKTEGKFMYPLIIIVDIGGTAEKPVITHLLVFCTSQPISPDAPAFETKTDPFENVLRQ
jgi:hypothetical protein